MPKKVDYYNFCTACGTELEPAEKVACIEEEGPLPPLCMDCTAEIVQEALESIGAAMTPLFAAVHEAMEEMNEAICQAMIEAEAEVRAEAECEDEPEDDRDDGASVPIE